MCLNKARLLFMSPITVKLKKYLWNVIVLRRGNSQYDVGKLNRKKQPQFVSSFEVCSGFQNFIVTQSTLLKFFRCSRFPEFDSN